MAQVEIALMVGILGPSAPSPYFVPGLPHGIRIELRQALISYQGYHMLLLTLAGNWTLYLAANERAQAAVMGVNANGEIVDVVARPAAAAA